MSEERRAKSEERRAIKVFFEKLSCNVNHIKYRERSEQTSRVSANIVSDSEQTSPAQPAILLLRAKPNRPLGRIIHPQFEHVRAGIVAVGIQGEVAFGNSPRIDFTINSCRFFI